MLKMTENIRAVYRQEYNGHMNGLTPEVYEYGSIGRFYYELSYGSGMFDNRYMFGITILEQVDPGKVRRRTDINTCLSGDSLPALAKQAREYLEEVCGEQSD